MPQPRWAQRVAVAEYVYSCLVADVNDPDAIVAGFKRYLAGPDPWQEAIVANYARRRLSLEAALLAHISTKWDYAEVDAWLKAVLLASLAEQYAHKTPRAVLISQALTTVEKHADPVLKKLAHAVLHRALRPDAPEK